MLANRSAVHLVSSSVAQASDRFDKVGSHGRATTLIGLQERMSSWMAIRRIFPYLSIHFSKYRKPQRTRCNPSLPGTLESSPVFTGHKATILISSFLDGTAENLLTRYHDQTRDLGLWIVSQHTKMAALRVCDSLKRGSAGLQFQTIQVIKEPKGGSAAARYESASRL